MSKTITIARTRSDGTIVEVCEDGKERRFPDRPMRAMTEAEISAAAAADPDARPMTADEWDRSRRVPRIRTVRRALGLTQEDFAARYHIPLGTLRDWEQGRAEPDQAAQAYVRAIAGDPDAVAKALDAGPTRFVNASPVPAR